MNIIEIKSVPEPKIIKELHALNQDNVPALGSLSTESELEELIKLSDTSMYILSNNEIIGFLVCFRERSTYHSPNYRFFNNNEPEFIYVDRIAIKQNNINKGLGSQLYNKLYKLDGIICPIAKDVSDAMKQVGFQDFHKAIQPLLKQTLNK